MAGSLSSNYSAGIYGNEIEEIREKNWSFNQTRMNQSLNELIQSMNINRGISNGKNDLDITDIDDEQLNLSTNVILNENSSTMEFKKYLEDLKRVI